MGPTEIRADRIRRLSIELVRLINVEGKTPQQAVSIIEARVGKMVSPKTARDYMQDIIHRVQST